MDKSSVSIRSDKSNASLIDKIKKSLISLRSNKIDPQFGQGEIVYGIDDDEIITKNPSFMGSRATLNSDESMMDISSGRCCLCWRKFVASIRRCWGTRYTENLNDNEEAFVKTTLKELFMYIIFITLLMIIAFGMSAATIYYYTSNIKDLYDCEDFNNIKSMNEFWTYFEDKFVKDLYWDNWYNSRPNKTNDFIYFENILLGNPQIRQLKVRNNTCETPKYFKEHMPACYGVMSSYNLNKSSFGIGNGSAWTYTSETQNTDATKYSGVFGSYSKGGYIQELGRNSSTTTDIIKVLKDNLWLDRCTRAVFVDFTLYNANINYFCVVKMVVEYPNTGGGFPKAEFRTVKLIRYLTTFDYFVLSCELLYLLFIFYYIIEEILEIKMHRLSYFREVWNILDIFVLMISLICAVFNVYRVIYVNDQLSNILNSKERYVDFDFISYWHKIYNEAMAITVFFSLIKIFKYISFNKRMTQLTDTLGNSMKDLTGFIVMFFIVFFAFAQSGFIIFSSQVEDFREFDHSVFTLFRVILGDFKFDRLYDAHHFLGPTFFVFYIFFVFFILLNMFVAIINDSYILVKEDIANTKEQFKVGTYLQRQILNRLKRDKIVKIQEVLEKTEIMNSEQLSFYEWRNELRKHGYADVEIQALFLRYDDDHDQMLDYAERNQMLQDLKARKLNMSDETPIEETDSEKHNCKSTMENSLQNIQSLNDSCNDIENEHVTENQYRDLVNRVNSVETGIMQIISKLDKVFYQLESIEQAKLEHQKSIGYSLEILTQSSESNLRF